MQSRAEAALVAMRLILRATELNAKLLARESGLAPSQLIVLQMLNNTRELTAGDIARATSLGHASVTALVDKLVAREFVCRKRDDTDRRRIWVEITPSGREVLEGAPDFLHNTFQSRFEELEEWEQAFIVAALERVTALLEADEVKRPVRRVRDTVRAPAHHNGANTSYSGP